MKILQITNNVCSEKRFTSADGITRVITQLCHYLINEYGDTCFLGYYVDDYPNETLVLPEFANSIQFKSQINKKELLDFITNNEIDVIQINLPVSKRNASHTKIICDVAHDNDIKVVFCLHVMPKFEGKEYVTLKEVLFYLKQKKPLWPKIKNWIITETYPLSSVFFRRVFRAKNQAFYNSCDRIVVFSNSYIDGYLSVVNRKDRSKLAVIPNPLSFTDHLHKEEVAKKRKEVIIVGRLAEGQKRISIALKIWKLIERNPYLNDWRLSVVGSGKDEKYYYWLAQKYNLQRISFEGNQDPRPYYKRASIMMLTSGYEGWPMVLMEAMPMGCCCLSFDSFGAINDIIIDGVNGRIIHENNLNEYASCLTELMLNDDKRIKMGINAIDSSQQFSMNNIGKLWKELYVELTKNNTYV